MRFDRALADHNRHIPVKAHLQIINLKIGEYRVRRFVAFQVFFFADDRSIEPNHREVVRLDPLWERAVAFETSFRPFVLDLNERLLVLGVVFYNDSSFARRASKSNLA